MWRFTQSLSDWTSSKMQQTSEDTAAYEPPLQEWQKKNEKTTVNSPGAVPPYKCLCGKIDVVYKFHNCRATKIMYRKIGLQTIRSTDASASARMSLENQYKFCLKEVFEDADNLMAKNKVWFKKMGAAILLAYKFLFRTSKGSLDGDFKQSVWTIQKHHLSVDGDNLVIDCTYEAHRYYRRFQLNHLQVERILQDHDKYLFSCVKTLVAAYLWQLILSWIYIQQDDRPSIPISGSFLR